MNCRLPVASPVQAEAKAKFVRAERGEGAHLAFSDVVN